MRAGGPIASDFEIEALRVQLLRVEHHRERLVSHDVVARCKVRWEVEGPTQVILDHDVGSELDRVPRNQTDLVNLDELELSPIDVAAGTIAVGEIGDQRPLVATIGGPLPCQIDLAAGPRFGMLRDL